MVLPAMWYNVTEENQASPFDGKGPQTGFCVNTCKLAATRLHGVCYLTKAMYTCCISSLYNVVISAFSVCNIIMLNSTTALLDWVFTIDYMIKHD